MLIVLIDCQLYDGFLNTTIHGNGEFLNTTCKTGMCIGNVIPAVSFTIVGIHSATVLPLVMILLCYKKLINS